MSFQIIIRIFAVVWVGGGGFLMFRYPEFFVKINARVGLNIGNSFTRRMGIVLMILAALSAIGSLIMHAFGMKGY